MNKLHIDTMKEETMFLKTRKLLAPHTIDDIFFASAYDLSGSKGRASLKTLIAHLYNLWGELPQERTLEKSGKMGLRSLRKDAAAPFVLLLCPSTYQSAPALLAALMPAVLAGVPHILPCFYSDNVSLSESTDHMESTCGSFFDNMTHASFTYTDEKPPVLNPDVLTALELAGLSDAFLLPTEQAALVLAICAKDMGVGRVVVLGRASPLEEVLQKAYAASVPCAVLSREPCYANFEEDSTLSTAMAVSAKPFVRPLWVWPELEPSWFRNVNYSFSLKDQL